MKDNGGVLVYHGLGSGKTLTSLAATQGIKTNVIVPASLRENYKKEVKKFTHGHKPKIMSYEQSAKVEPDAEALVVDEAHMAGRHDSKRSTDLFNKGKQYKYRMLLTGTPVRNHPSELAPLLNTVVGDKRIPSDPQEFSKNYIEEITERPSLWNRIVHKATPSVSYKIKNKDLFRKIIEGHVDYHETNKEHFPSVSHEEIQSPMSSEQKKYYDFVLGKAGPALRWKIRSGLPPSKTEAKNLNSFLSGARQVSNSTLAFGGKEVTPKMQAALNSVSNHIKKTPNFKAMVYSNFLDSGVKAYARELEKQNIPHAIFDGSLSDSKRKQMVEDYNSGKIKVLLLSGAGAQGLDLKGTKLVQLLEPHWNNPRLEQAMGRAIRYKSHSHLPQNERHVHVERYTTVLPRTLIQKVLGKKQKDFSTDQYLNMLSKDKENLNKQFLDVLKDVGSH